jgi:4-hydroxybenzoate polyprenyltransferase
MRKIMHFACKYHKNMMELRRLQNYLMFAFPLLFSMFIYLGKQRYPIFRFGFIILFIGYALFRSYTLFFGGYPDAHFPYISIFHYNTIR